MQTSAEKYVPKGQIDYEADRTEKASQESSELSSSHASSQIKRLTARLQEQEAATKAAEDDHRIMQEACSAPVLLF